MEGSKIWVIFVVLVIAGSIWASDESDDESDLEPQQTSGELRKLAPQGEPLESSDETEIEIRCSGHGCHTSCTSFPCQPGQVCVMVGGKPTCRDKAALVFLLCSLKKCGPGLGVTCVLQLAILSIGLWVAICIPVGPGETCTDLVCLPDHICVMIDGLGSCVKKSSHQSKLCGSTTCPADRSTCHIQLTLDVLGIWIAVCIGGIGITNNPKSCINVICPPDSVCVLDGDSITCQNRALLEISVCLMHNCPSWSPCVMQATLIGIWVGICLGCVGPHCPNTCENVDCPHGCVCILENGKPSCVKRDELELKLCAEINCLCSCCIQEKSLGVWIAVCNQIGPPTCSSLTCKPGQVCVIENGVPCCQDKNQLQIRLCLTLTCPLLQICVIFESGIGTGIWIPRCTPCSGSQCTNPCAGLICPKHYVCVVRANGRAVCEDRRIIQIRLCSRHRCPMGTMCIIRSDGMGRWSPVCVPCVGNHCGATCASVRCPFGKVCIISNGKASCEKKSDIKLFLCARKRCRRGQRCIIKEKPGPRGFFVAICINIRPAPCLLDCGRGYICRWRPIRCRRPPCRQVPTCVVDPNYDPCKYHKPCPKGFKCVSVPYKNCNAFKDQRGLALDEFEDDDNDFDDTEGCGDNKDVGETDDVGDNGDISENGEVGDNDDLGDDNEQETNLELDGRYQDQTDDDDLTSSSDTTDLKPTVDRCQVQTHRHRIEGCPPVAECQPIPNYDPCEATTCPKDHYCVTVPDLRCERGCGSQESCSEEKCLEEILTKSKPKFCPRIAKCIPKSICQKNPCKNKKCKKGHRCEIRKGNDGDDENSCKLHAVCVRFSDD